MSIYFENTKLRNTVYIHKKFQKSVEKKGDVLHRHNQLPKWHEMRLGRFKKYGELGL